MLHPFLENTAKISQYIFLWIVYGLLQAFVFDFLVPMPFALLLVDGLLHAFVFGILGVLLWSVVKFGNFSALAFHQRLINYIALALLCIGIWLVLGAGLFFLCFDQNSVFQLLPLLPVRSLIGLMIYLLIIQRFRDVSFPSDLRSEVLDEAVIEEPIFQNLPAVELLERIAVKSGAKIHVVLVEDILYLQADGDYVQIFTANGKYLKEQTMKFFEEHLPSNQFVRVHRSVIVNVQMISRIELYEKQNQQLTLKNGSQIKTSPAGYKALRLALNM